MQLMMQCTQMYIQHATVSLIRKFSRESAKEKQGEGTFFPTRLQHQMEKTN